MRRKITTCFICLTLMTAAFLFLTADMVSAGELDNINKEIKQKQKELDEGKKAEKELLQAIGALEEQIYQLQTEIDNGEVELAQLEKELEKAEKKIAGQNEDLSARLRTMYKNGSVGFMDVLLNSGSFSDFLTNYDMVEKIYDNDREVLKKMEKAQEELEQRKQAVEALQAELEDAKATAATEVANVAAEKEKIAKSNKKTARMIDDLEAEMKKVQAELEKKQSMGKMSSSTTSKYTGGVFLWPTPGNIEISSEYGWRICPFHGREFHAALDVAAPEGANIVASANGTIVYSGWYGGFGNSVMIDHGGGIVSQYNHCSETVAVEGQKVKKGEVVAKVGSTGFSTGPHLDYRVYKNGEVEDPRGYLGK